MKMSILSYENLLNNAFLFRNFEAYLVQFNSLIHIVQKKNMNSLVNPIGNNMLSEFSLIQLGRKKLKLNFFHIKALKKFL